MHGTFTWKNEKSDSEFTETLDQFPRDADRDEWSKHTPEQRAEALLEFYNSTLRPHESARYLVRVERDLDDEDPNYCEETRAILQSGMLPDLDFFKPNENFKNWLSSCIHLRYHPIVEVGAGGGLLSKLMLDEGFKVTPLDIYARPNPHTLVQVASEELIIQLVKDLPKNAGMFIARPCHSGFAERFFKLHLKFCNQLFAYYIGLPRNVSGDLPDMSYEIVAENVGEDGENVYQVYGKKTDCTNLYTLKTRAGVYEFDEANEEFVSVRETGLMTAGLRVSNWDVDVREAYIGMRYTYQRPPKLENILTDKSCGWIDPEGNYYKVPYTRHSEFIYNYLYLDESKDITGWVKVWPPGTNDYDLRWYKECRVKDEDFEPNGKQLRVMREVFGIDHQVGIYREALLPSRSDKY